MGLGFKISIRLYLAIALIFLFALGVALYSYALNSEISALLKLVEGSNTTRDAMALKEIHALENSISRRLWFLTVFVLLAGTAFATALAIEIKRVILKPLERFSTRIGEIARGDLKVSVEHARHDEIGQLAEHENMMINNLNTMIAEVMHSANIVVNSMNELLDKQRSALSDSNDQLQISLQISTAADQLGSTIADIAKNTTVASDSAKHAMDIAEEGNKLADETTRSMGRVLTGTEDLSEMVLRLNQRVIEIGDIVTVINDIADQTNLLALNAAIEAARAGEQGRGFSVVADEVRKLAERTIKATTEISGKIKAVQTESRMTAETMGTSAIEVSKATSNIQELGSSLKDIVESAIKVRDEITHIASASVEQSSTAEQVARSTEESLEIAGRAINETKAAMGEALKLIISMSEFRKSTDKFNYRMSTSDLLHVIQTDIVIFLCRVQAALKHLIKLEPAALADHRASRMGKWYYGPGAALYSANRSFKDIEPQLIQFHSLAIKALEVNAKGANKDAEAVFEQMRMVSLEIIRLLEELKSTSAA